MAPSSLPPIARAHPPRQLAPSLRPEAVSAASIAAALIAAASLLGCAAAPSGPAPPLAEVLEVTDGDTIVVRSGSHTEPVRLLGIDTPEVAHHGQSAECFGPEASDRTAELFRSARSSVSIATPRPATSTTGCSPMSPPRMA